jgi:glycosyltransferase involved in cell wall biosynthesis
MLLLDLTHTSHTRARTGIQQVARSLHGALGDGGTGITWDAYAQTWRPLVTWEQANLSAPAAAGHRGVCWPWSARLHGHWQRLRGARPVLPEATGLIVPELFSAATAAALPALFAKIHGPKVAVFHDAIALKLPELAPVKTVARFPGYLQELLAFDGIAAVSADSRDTLLDYWRWLGVAHHPPVISHPLGLATFHLLSEMSPAAKLPVVLSVGTIEGRKNHLALLDAAETLWAQGRSFELHLVGLAHPETGRTALARIEALQAAGRPVRYAGAVDDATLARAYADCTFTVYPSLMEGFGLPVLESLSLGRPCICSARGALGESSQGGGCLTLDTMDAPSLAGAIDRLLANPAETARLASAAQARPLRPWSVYAAELTHWMRTLPLRSHLSVCQRPTP